MGGYPKVYNIEMDPHDDLNVMGLFPVAMVPALAAVRVEREAEPLFRHGGPAMEPRHAPILATIPPPAQYAATFFAGVGRDRLMQWRPAWLTMEGIHWAGVALAFAGFILAFVSAGCFVLRRTTLNPAGQPAHLVVRRAHAWSRNPMYLSLAIIYAGVALALGKAWPLVLVVLPWAAMNWVVNPFDEARLKRGFSMPEKEIVATPRHPA